MEENGPERYLWPITRNRYESTYNPLLTVLDDNALIRGVDPLSGEVIDGIVVVLRFHSLNGSRATTSARPDDLVDLHLLDNGGSHNPAATKYDKTILYEITGDGPIP